MSPGPMSPVESTGGHDTDIDLFAGVPVSDYPRAVAWFERLLGEPATFQPHDTESVWTVAEHSHLYAVLEPEHAGHARVTLFVTDLSAFSDAAADRGLHPVSRETYGGGVVKLVYRDDDGNEIGVGGRAAY